MKTNSLYQKLLMLLVAGSMLLFSIPVFANTLSELDTLVEDFQSYNNKIVSSEANTSTSDLNYYRIMDDNGKVRHNNFYSQRVVNGANITDDLEALKSTSLSKYNAFYSNGVYEGNASNNNGFVFNYKGEPVTTSLPGWYGYISNPQAYCSDNNNSYYNLQVLNETGNDTNKILQFALNKSQNGQVNMFGRYDLNYDNYTTIKSKVKFAGAYQGKEFIMKLTQGNPITTSTSFPYGSSAITDTDNVLGKGSDYVVATNAVDSQYTNLIVPTSFGDSYDAVTFREGNIYFGTNAAPVGTYTPNSSGWYTISYYIDNRDAVAKTGLKVVDASGNTVANVPISECTDTGYFDFKNGSDVYGLQFRQVGYGSGETVPSYSHTYCNIPYAYMYLDDVSVGKSEFTEDFNGYNLKLVKSVANSVDSDLNFWKILLNNGKIRYNGFYSQRIVNGANNTDELEALESTNPSKYNSFYGNGVYEGLAYNNTNMIFNYKGEPVTTGLPGWYGYVYDSNNFQEFGSEPRAPLNIVSEAGNTSNQALQMGLSYTTSSSYSMFGRYDLNLEGYTALSTKIKFPSIKQGKSFKIRLTQGAPLLKTVRNYCPLGNITASDSTSAANTLLGLTSGDLVATAVDYTFTNIVTDESFSNAKVYDAVTFSEGKIYYGSNTTPVGVYDAYSSGWYTVTYYIDNRTSTTKTGLLIVDANGATIVNIPLDTFTDTSLISFNSGSDIYGLQYRYTGYNKTTDTLPSNSNIYPVNEFFSVGATRVYLDDMKLIKLSNENSVTATSSNVIGTELSVDVNIKYSADVTASVIVALYNKTDGSLDYVSCDPSAIGLGSTNKTVKITVNNGFNINDYNIKCFLWNSMTDIKPLIIK